LLAPLSSMRFLLCSVFALSIAACAPSTTFNRGIDISFHPSGKADAQQRLVSSAVELKTENETTLVKDTGAVYLGELEVIGEKAGGMYMGKAGASTLSGRISLEAANRGATHFHLASSRVEHGIETHTSPGGNSTSAPTSKTHARYVLFRLEPVAWEKLPNAYRPTAVVASSPGSAPNAAPATAERSL